MVIFRYLLSTADHERLGMLTKCSVWNRGTDHFICLSRETRSPIFLVRYPSWDRGLHQSLPVRTASQGTEVAFPDDFTLLRDGVAFLVILVSHYAVYIRSVGYEFFTFITSEEMLNGYYSSKPRHRGGGTEGGP